MTVPRRHAPDSARRHAPDSVRRHEPDSARRHASDSVRRHALTIDVEDYFQVQAFADRIDRASWETIPRRVDANMGRILDQFARAGVHATFFTLAWVAERHPAIIRRIVAEGHELASHGTDHTRVDAQDTEAFRADIRHSKRVLEDIGGVAIRGYRAATFSINVRTPWAFEVLAEEGFGYSSSTYPIRHDLYGAPDAPRAPYRPHDGALWEIPMTTWRVGGHNIPCSGGGYFRLLPYALYRGLLRRAVAAQAAPAIFYLHPWEVDPDQPRVPDSSRMARFRHYTNLSRTAARLDRLLRDFAWDRMDRVYGDLLAAPVPASAGLAVA